MQPIIHRKPTTIKLHKNFIMILLLHGHMKIMSSLRLGHFSQSSYSTPYSSSSSCTTIVITLKLCNTLLFAHKGAQAPPATVFTQPLQCQMPTHVLLIFNCKYITRAQDELQLSYWYLPTEETVVLCVLADFYFLHHLSER